MCSPTLSGVFSPLHLLEGKAVVPVQQITCVTPYTTTMLIKIQTSKLGNDEQMEESEPQTWMDQDPLDS